MRNWPLRIVRTQDSDTISAQDTGPLINQDIQWSVDNIWEFIRNKDPRYALLISGDVPPVLVAAVVARFVGYYRLIAYDSVVVHSRFPEHPVGSKV